MCGCRKDIGLEIENRTQWHSTFCTSMELELMENESGLNYEKEYSLSKEPLRIDLLIIKKNPYEKIKNELGAFFRGYNIVEFKSPDDKLNIDTFYKVIAYACLYKSETGAVDGILDTDITITLIREQKPMKLLQQLSEKYNIVTTGRGIYYIEGLLLPLQIVVTQELDSSEHVWLKSMTRSMDICQAEKLLDSYESLQDDKYHAKAKAVVSLASDVNTFVFKQIILGGGKMNEELKEMLLPELGELKQLLAANQMELAGKNAELAKNKAMIAEKDAIIAELRRRLNEAGAMP